MTDGFLMDADCRHGLTWHACTTCATFPTYPYDEWRYDDMNGWSNPEDDPATPTETALLDEIRQLRTQIPDADNGDGENTPQAKESTST